MELRRWLKEGDGRDWLVVSGYLFMLVIPFLSYCNQYLITISITLFIFKN